MKTPRVDYIKIIMYSLFGVIFAISSYLIILNINHYNSLSSTIKVSEIDDDYSKYKENVLAIEKKLDTIKSDDKSYLSLTKALTTMKKDGVYRLIPKQDLNYRDLYNLNDYFMEQFINNSWISYLKELEISSKYQDIINMLVNNSNYLNKVFTANSLILYDSTLDNKIDDNYHFILKNYLMYSSVILSMCNDLGGVDG